MNIFKIFKKKVKEDLTNTIIIKLNHPFIEVKYFNGSRTANTDYLSNDGCILSKYFNGKYVTIRMEDKKPDNEIFVERRIFVNN